MQMQDRYAGDVGDFSKFALARALIRDLGGKVGVIWYRFQDETHNNDGKHILYFDKSDWTDCDPDLVGRLQTVAHSKRSIAQLEAAGILPEDSLFFSEPLFADGKLSWSRKAWFERALKTVEDCRIVIVDPDNGIAGANHRVTSKSGGKHITHEEIGKLASRHDCVVIYHHFDRSTSHAEQARSKICLLEKLAPGKSVIGLRYKRISSRAYLIVSDPGCAQSVLAATQSLCKYPWNMHFEATQ